MRAVTLTAAGAIVITGSGFGSQPGYTGISGTPGCGQVQDARQDWMAGYPGDTLTVVVWGTDGQQSTPFQWTVPASAGRASGAPYPCSAAASAWSSLQQRFNALQQSGAQAQGQARSALINGGSQLEGLLQQA